MDSFLYDKGPQYQFPSFCWGDNFQSQILKKGRSEKNECLGGLNDFLPLILASGEGGVGGEGAYYVSCQKKYF